MLPFQPDNNDDDTLEKLLSSTNYAPPPPPPQQHQHHNQHQHHQNQHQHQDSSSFHQMPTALSPLLPGDDWQWPSPYPSISQEPNVLNQLVTMADTPLPTTAVAPTAAISNEGHALQERECNYELVVAQQPIRARMCGFGDKDRRPVSPPPIVELMITTKDGKNIDPAQVDVSHFVVHCDSWQADGITEANIISPTDPSKKLDLQKTRNLVGSQVASAVKLYNVQGQLGIFFIFSDISIRLEGRYRLGFSLIDVRTPPSSVFPMSQILAKVYTDVITVYSGKSFPGVVSRTPLSVCFLKQGVKIPVRKEDQQPGSSVASGSSGSRKRPIDQDLSIQDEDSIDSG